MVGESIVGIESVLRYRSWVLLLNLIRNGTFASFRGLPDDDSIL